MRSSLVRTLSTLALFLAAAAGWASPASAQDAWAFTDVTVLPMDAERTLEARTVVVENGVITAVGHVDSVSVPDGATTIDGTGRYLMPGLAEMHAHVPPAQQRPPAETLDDIFFLYIANGITTIRGMLGSPYQIDLREEIRAGQHLAPSFYVAAPSLNGNTAPTPQDAERLMRAAAAGGYDLMKIHPGVPRDAWDRMVEVAEEVGLTFAGHVPQEVGVEYAIQTGMSTIDHMDGFLRAASRPDGSYDNTKMRELAARAARAGVYIVPTQYLWENLNGARSADEVLDNPEMRYVSRQQRESWRNRASGGSGRSPEELRTFLDARDAQLRYLAEAGAPLLMGTDSPQLFNVPGFALYWEIREMAEAGLTNFQILESGTRNVGEYVQKELGYDDLFGLVAPGHRADLVLLHGNPLESLDNLQARVGVMVRGRWVPVEEIGRGLEALEAKHAGG
ncbi:MAG: amidohydrolase family protein [Gemmatimonadota bacterium]|nr:amidohydrolase family protein [Gemmatimonadota bacterium]